MTRFEVTDGWETVAEVSDKPQGLVRLVRRRTGRGWEWGYFKHAGADHRYYAGPMAANEWIAARLLAELGLPAARVLPARVGELPGVVSVLRPAARRWSRRWRDLPLGVRRRHLRTFHRPEGLYGMIAFDIWTTNIDRGSGKNIVVYRPPGRRRYRFYLIDHALALYGSYHKWAHYGTWPGPTWLQPGRVYTVPEGLEPARRRLRPWVRRIRRLDPARYRAWIAAVPPDYLSPEEAAFIDRLLTTRQRELPHIIDGWLRQRRKRR